MTKQPLMAFQEIGLMTSQTSQIKLQAHPRRRGGTTGTLVRWLRRGVGAGVAAIALGLSGSPALAGGDIQVGQTQSGIATAATTAMAGHSCGELSERFTLALAGDHDALVVRMEDASNTLVMWVKGPGGEYCIKGVNGAAEMEGYWVGGDYEIWVGRRPGTTQDVSFRLTVSAQ